MDIIQQPRDYNMSEKGNWSSAAGALLLQEPLDADRRAPEADTVGPPRPLRAAIRLFERLAESGVRYGVFKSTGALDDALAGAQDLDVLVSREDYQRFCAVMIECHGIRAVTHPSLASPGREDWLIPDFAAAKYMHLDVHVAVRLGRKLNKCYPFYEYDSISRWRHMERPGLVIPIVSDEDEARITLSRIAFREWAPPWKQWVAVRGDWKGELEALLFPPGSQQVCKVAYSRSGGTLVCRLWKDGEELLVRREDLRRLRAMVRASSGFSAFAAVPELAVHLRRKVMYVAAHLLNRVVPGSIMDRRRPAGGGLWVAIMAPDEVVKSTQIRRLVKIFGWKFSCANACRFHSEGEKSQVGKFIKRAYLKRHAAIDATLIDKQKEHSSKQRLPWALTAVELAVRNALRALQHYAAVKRASRMAARGLIVISDRWPQDLRSRPLDEPLSLPDQPYPPRLASLAALEVKIYRKIALCQPALTMHLVADFAIADQRNPGGLARKQLEDQIAVTRELQAQVPDTHVVDAIGSIDDVTAKLFKAIWSQL